MAEYFIHEAIEHPGRVHHYLGRVYGRRAFTDRGTIREDYLEKAEQRARKERNVSLERAIILAKRLRAYSREKRMRY